jgi:hypothetical protein
VLLKDLDGERMVPPPPGSPNRDRFGAAFASVEYRMSARSSTIRVFGRQCAAYGSGYSSIHSLCSGFQIRPCRQADPVAIELSMLFFPANRPRSALVNAVKQLSGGYIDA